MKQKIEETKMLLDKYHDYLIDKFNVNISKKTIDLFLQQEFNHYHKNNSIDDECAICGYDLRNKIHFKSTNY